MISSYRYFVSWRSISLRVGFVPSPQWPSSISSLYLISREVTSLPIVSAKCAGTESPCLNLNYVPTYNQSLWPRGWNILTGQTWDLCLAGSGLCLACVWVARGGVRPFHIQGLKWEKGSFSRKTWVQRGQEMKINTKQEKLKWCPLFLPAPLSPVCWNCWMLRFPSNHKKRGWKDLSTYLV